MAVQQACEWQKPTLMWIRLNGRWVRRECDRGAGTGVTISEFAFKAALAGAYGEAQRIAKEQGEGCGCARNRGCESDAVAHRCAAESPLNSAAAADACRAQGVLLRTLSVQCYQ